MEPERSRIRQPRGHGGRYVAAALIASAIISLFLVFKTQAARKMPDFEVYWRAGVRARHAEPLYRVEDQHYRLKYLPAFAVLAIPAGVLPLDAAKAAWFAASVVSIAALLALSIHMLPDRRKRLWILIGAALIVMGKFYGHELVLGQVNLLLGVLLAGATVLLRRNYELSAGALVAFAVVVKPYAIIFIPWLAARRKITALAIACIGMVAAILLPAVIYGLAETIRLHVDWWNTVSASTAPNLLNPDNVSIAAMYAKWLGPGPTASWLATITCVGLIGCAAVALGRQRIERFPEGLESALLMTLMPLISPQGWDYVFLVATPAVIFVVNYGDRLALPFRIVTVLALLAIGLSIFDVLGRAAYAAFMATSAITVCFLIVIAALLSLRLRDAA